MKDLIFFLSTAVMALAFASCGGSGGDSKASGAKLESRLKSSENMDDAVKFSNQWEARKTEADANIAAFMEKKGGSVDIPFEQAQFTDQFKLTSLKVFEANRKNIIMKSVIGEGPAGWDNKVAYIGFYDDSGQLKTVTTILQGQSGSTSRCTG